MACPYLSLVSSSCVIMEMAQQIQDRATVTRGAPLVEPSNKFFWFNTPQLVLFLIHFALFQNAFQMAFFLWTVMGSQNKRSIFEEKTSKALKKWQKNAKERKRLRELSGGARVVDISNSGIRSPGNTPSGGSSPIHLLHKNNHRSSTLESEIDIPPSPSDMELSDIEGLCHVHDHHSKNQDHEFSFSRS
ncbi:hypothetical protein L1987_39777 [Smallanthus sonchifolius]|uniref:Uncharacterized protein n=1 Tax=Smallanthus sonchifolius TaxID=185202 RepID=A0ACB9HP55_9ASTR|nr:hypothetical protein L1987_39777 [Smallanthus sonchifolius]